MTAVMSKARSIDQKIINMLKVKPERTFSERDISDHLKIPRNHQKEFKVTLYKMIEKGDVIVAKKGRYQWPRQSQVAEGKLSVNQKGFGFVITDRSVPDIFIGRRQMGNAVNGDIVKARVHSGGKSESPRGSVIRVVERGNARFVGTVFVEDRVDKLAIQPLTPSRGIRILSKRSIEYKRGQTVVADVKDWGSNVSPILVEVIEIIGEAGEPANDLKIILSRYGYE